MSSEKTESRMLNNFITSIIETNESNLASSLIKSLNLEVQNLSETTMQGFIQNIKNSIQNFFKNAKGNKNLKNRSLLTFRSITEIYINSITKKIKSIKKMENIKQKILETGKELIKNFENASSRIFKFSQQIIKNNNKILIKGYSHLVKQILLNAHSQGLKLTIYILETRPECEGYQMYKELSSQNMHCVLLIDSAMGFIMENVDFVLTGAELVTENGGIVNRIGTYSLALCASCLEKPFYVVAENYKFSRIFPLGQGDLSQDVRESDRFIMCNSDGIEGLRFVSPKCDFTPPSFISFIVSDGRIFKPGSISDEMLQLFNF